MGRLGKARRAIDAMQLPKTPPCPLPTPSVSHSLLRTCASGSALPSTHALLSLAAHVHAACSQHLSIVKRVETAKAQTLPCTMQQY